MNVLGWSVEYVHLEIDRLGTKDDGQNEIL